MYGKMSKTREEAVVCTMVSESIRCKSCENIET